MTELWSMDEAGEVLVALAVAGGLPVRAYEVSRAASGELDSARWTMWLTGTARRLGIEAEPVVLSRAELARAARAMGPALLVAQSSTGRGLLAIVGRGRRRQNVRLLTPDGSVVERSISELVRWVADEDRQTAMEVDDVVARLALLGRAADRAREAILLHRSWDQRLSGIFMLRRLPTTGIRAELLAQGGGKAFMRLVLARFVGLLAEVAAWAMLGRSALEGRFDRGWLIAAALMLATCIPLRAWITSQKGELTILVGSVLRRRLLAGALELRPESVRHEGVGGLLGRAIEGETLEALALDGGVGVVFATIDLAMALVVVASGAGGRLSLAILAVSLLFAGAAIVAQHRVRGRWTDERLAQTEAFVETVVGHRTRLVQGGDSELERDDARLSRYAILSQQLDSTQVLPLAIAPAVWLILGFASLGPAWVRGAAVSSFALAVGGVLLAARGLMQAARGATALSAVSIAWRRLHPLLEVTAEAGVAPAIVCPLAPEPGPDAGDEGREGDDVPVVLEARELRVEHGRGSKSVLRGASLLVRTGDRVLLEGESGSGKSSLVAVLGGVRKQDGGALLVRGLDVSTLGVSGWARVAAAPQFHDNHILTGSLAYNLLLARDWPASTRDHEEAARLCEELGLGPLLARMPGGLGQMVGDSGWQLSHGEKSRVYLARALLQGAEVVILDESFASLDPATLERCVLCASRRARALVVVADPWWPVETAASQEAPSIEVGGAGSSERRSVIHAVAAHARTAEGSSELIRARTSE